MKDPKITTLTEQLNESGYKFLLVTEKVSAANPNIREASVTHCINDSPTKSLFILAATLAREAKARPELMQFLRLTNEFINDVDKTFLDNNIQEVK